MADGISIQNLTNAADSANTAIRPIDNSIYMSGFTIDLTIFILGSIFMLFAITYVFFMVFGRPMMVAMKAGGGNSMIQHTNTPKSAEFKTAAVSGGGFRYANIRDGTVAASPNAVYSVYGKNMVLTYAQLGITIPVNILAAVSTLLYSGIGNIQSLYQKYGYTKIEKVMTETGEIEVPKDMIRNENILTGYNFDNFKELKKQTGEEKLIPMVIEAFPEFITKNINADYTEKHIKLEEELYKVDNPPSQLFDIMKWVIPVLAILVIGFLVVK